MKTSEIKLVVFDIAGTTVKDEKSVHRILINTVSKFGYNVSIDEVNAVMGYPKPFAIEELLKLKEKNEDKITLEFVNNIHEVFETKMLDFYKNSSDVVAVNNAEETFLLLKKLGIKVALDTGFSKKNYRCNCR